MKITNTKEVTSKRFIALIAAESGVGKTYQARFLKPEEKTLIISAESGLLCLKGTNIAVCEINTMDDLKEVYMMLAKGTEYKTIFIDSITEIAQKLLSDMKASPEYNDRKMALAMYGDYAEDLTRMIKSFRDLQDYSVIMTCLTAKEKDGLEMIDSFIMPGSKVSSNMKAWYDLVLHLKVVQDENGKPQRFFITDSMISPLAKDRSGTLDQYEEADIGKIMAKVLS